MDASSTQNIPKISHMIIPSREERYHPYVVGMLFWWPLLLSRLLGGLFKSPLLGILLMKIIIFLSFRN